MENLDTAASSKTQMRYGIVCRRSATKLLPWASNIAWLGCEFRRGNRDESEGALIERDQAPASATPAKGMKDLP